MKTVLITGSSRGLGAAIAAKFAYNGYNVIINYLNNEDQASALAKSLEKQYHIKTLCIKANIASEDEVEKMINEVKDKFKSLDCLVNNAGIALDNTYQEKRSEEFQKVLNVNLIGTFLVTKYAAAIMDTGSIINISSDCALGNGYVEGIDYNASKAGVITLTQDFAKILAPKIRVNAVAPGWINTDMNREIEPHFKEKEISKILLNRFAEPSEIANVVYFLASDEASYINGSLIRVDGGKR